MGPWTCPKCSRVWGPGTSACKPCNSKVDAKEARGYLTPQPSRGPVTGGASPGPHLPLRNAPGFHIATVRIS